MVKKTFKIEYIILATFVLILFVLILNSKNICETFYNNNKVNRVKILLNALIKKTLCKNAFLKKK